MNKHEEFFQNFGYIKDHLGHFYYIEELYQAFKARLIAELTVDGWSQCGRIGGELKDKEGK